MVVFAGATYGLAGFAREQVCTFMCPWPRLQGAIWDPEAYTVNYRNYRGEQRTSASGAAAKLAIVGHQGDSAIHVGAESSETFRVTLTKVGAGQADVVFSARDEQDGTVISAIDRFVER